MRGERTERERARALMILGLQSMTQALWHEANITDEGIAVQALVNGADSAREIIREVAEGTP